MQYIDDNGEKYNYRIRDLNSRTKVRVLRVKTSQASGKPVNRIVLVYINQYEDFNDHRTLGYYNIKRDSFIIMRTL